MQNLAKKENMYNWNLIFKIMEGIKKFIESMKAKRENRRKHELELEAKQRIRIEGGDAGVYVTIDGIRVFHLYSDEKGKTSRYITATVETALNLISTIRGEYVDSRL